MIGIGSAQDASADITGTVAIQGVMSNAMPINTEYSVSLNAFTPFDIAYNPNDNLLEAKNLDLTQMPTGFKLNKEKTNLDLNSITAISDSSYFIFNGVNISKDYSGTFFNDTVNAVVETEAVAGAGTEVTAIAGGSAGTAITGAYHGNGSLVTATYTSDLGGDLNQDGDFVDSGDRTYFPISGNNFYMLIQILADQNATSTTDYASIKATFSTAGSDFSVEIRSFMGSGDSGWVFTTTTAIYSAYDADNTGISVIIPFAEIVSDASASVNMKGLDKIDYIFNIDEAGNQITLTSHNVAIFSDWPSYSDAVDDDEDRDFNDAGNVFANPWDDNDLLQTSVVEAGTETWDNTLPLLVDQSGLVTLSHEFKYLDFSGVVSIDPTTGSTVVSSAVSGVANKYLTTETLYFDTTAIEPLKTPGNVWTYTNVQLNVTIDDQVLYDSVDYEENLVEFIDTNGISQKNVFKSAWSATTVTDDSEIQYDQSDFSSTTGALEDYVLQYYTRGPYATVVVAATTTTATSTTVDGVVVVAGSSDEGLWDKAQNWWDGLITGDVSSWSQLLGVIAVLLAFFGLVRFARRK